MPTYMLRGLPTGLIAQAKAKARESGSDLSTVLVAFLTSYVKHGSIQSSGGHARMLSTTDDQRRAIAQKGAQARWKDHQKPDSGS